MKKLKISIMMLIVVCMFGTTSCGSSTDNDRVASDETVSEGTENVTEETEKAVTAEELKETEDVAVSDESMEADSSTKKSEEGNDVEENENLMEIETDYGNLYYPATWKDSLHTKITNEENIMTVTFDAQINSQEYALFKVMICNEEGDSVGTITDSSGTSRNVFVEIFELNDIDDLSEDAQNQLYAMQEGVNSLTEALK